MTVTKFPSTHTRIAAALHATFVGVAFALALGLHAVALAGLIKRVVGAYRYSLARLGRSAIAAGCRLTEQTTVPALACQSLLRRFPEDPIYYGQNDPALPT